MLLEFLFREDHKKYKYALATDFAKPSYKRLELIGRAKTLYADLCAKVNHLTYDRTDRIQEKIGWREQDEILELIHKEIVRGES